MGMNIPTVPKAVKTEPNIINAILVCSSKYSLPVYNVIIMYFPIINPENLSVNLFIF